MVVTDKGAQLVIVAPTAQMVADKAKIG